MENVLYQVAFFGGLVVFFGAHFYTTFRQRDGTGLADVMHRGAYMGLYSLLTLASFVAFVWGFANRPFIVVWTPENFPWIRHITMTLMLPAIILLVSAYMRPVGFIKKAVRHPMLAAVTLWSLGHLLANGDLYAIILFGSFLIYSVVDRVVVGKRGDVGAANANANILGDLLSIAIGSAIFGLLIYELHAILFGVSPLA